jgi:hypothetical protein
MSSSTDPEFDLDLHFLPAWAQQPAAKNRYADFAGEPERGEWRGERRGRPGPNRPPDRRTRPPQGAPEQEAPAAEPPGRFGRGRGRRLPQRRLEETEPLLELNVSFVPDDHGVDSLTRQIRMTGRAYPLFEIARMILQKPERHTVTIAIRKDAQGQPKQPIFSCAVDNTLWLSEDDAVRHVLSRHFDLFYKAERTPVDPPKGTYTFVAQCGMSGVILGPPNYHDYQKQLRKLHAERFSRVPFEVFKARVKIVRDEAVVKQWIEDQSYRTEYVCLNMPETVKLASREDVEQHFRACHLANIIQPVESFQLLGNTIRDIRAPALNRLVRRKLEEQRRFPLQVMTALSQQFASRGLQFFKVNRTVTHVAVARPHYLDLETIPVSEGVRRIVEFVDQHRHCNRKDLVETLAPTPTPTPTPTPPQEGAPGPGEPLPAEPSPDQTAVITDLHWLIHQGHVIEFATGVLETAKKPLPKPPKPERAPTEESPPAEPSLEGQTAGPSPDAGSAPPAPDATPGPAASAETDSAEVVPDLPVPAPSPEADEEPTQTEETAGEPKSVPPPGI